MSSMAKPRGSSGDENKHYFDRVRDLQMHPLWQVIDDLMPAHPVPKEKPFQWKWKEIRPLVHQAAEIVSIEEAPRRVLMLLNPGLPREQAASTQTLYAGIQILLPGEIAPAHRHTPNALRFVMEGTGAFTNVAGEKTILGQGDVVTTPTWTWHDHGNDANGPVVWLDALDIPLINAVSGMFYEDFPAKHQPVSDASNSSQKTYGRGLRPVGEHRSTAYSPILNYPYATTKAALEALPASAHHPSEGRILEYVNPLTGGPILPTIDAYLQRIDPGVRLRPRRRSSSAIFMGVEGRGTLTVDGQDFAWEPYDVLVVPAWAQYSHRATGTTPSILFSYTNTPTMRALSLYREDSPEPA